MPRFHFYLLKYQLKLYFLQFALFSISFLPAGLNPRTEEECRDLPRCHPTGTCRRIICVFKWADPSGVLLPAGTTHCPAGRVASPSPGWVQGPRPEGSRARQGAATQRWWDREHCTSLQCFPLFVNEHVCKKTSCHQGQAVKMH